MNITRRSLMIASASLTPIGLALAQASYPNRPIKIIAPFTAGAGADTLLRKVAEAAGKLIGQPMIVDNKPGAQAAIAARIVAKAPNDGYTLMMGGNSSHAANVHTLKNAGYDPLKDEGRDYAQRLSDAGVRASHVEYPDMVHDFYILGDVSPAVVEAAKETAATLKAALA